MYSKFAKKTIDYNIVDALEVQHHINTVVSETEG